MSNSDVTDDEVVAKLRMVDFKLQQSPFGRERRYLLQPNKGGIFLCGTCTFSSATMHGPPPSAAGPSTSSTGLQSATPVYTHENTVETTPQPPVNPENSTQSSTFVFHSDATNQSQSSQFYSVPSQAQSTTQPPGYAYYNYASNAWGNAWGTGAYPYGAPGTYQYPPAQSGSQPYSYPPHAAPGPLKSPSPSPSPPPEFHREWDAIVKKFLQAIGFTQSVRGFEADMIVLNSDWERQKVPTALGELMKDLLVR